MLGLGGLSLRHDCYSICKRQCSHARVSSALLTIPTHVDSKAGELEKLHLWSFAPSPHIDTSYVCLCRMCLFLQSQDFQRHTKVMINSLYSSSQHAAEQLNAVDAHLTQSLSSMDSMAGKLSSVETAQEQQLQLSQQNLKGVQQLHVDSQQVHAQLANALQNEVRQLATSASK